MSMQKPSKSYPKRGEIYIADLNPVFGREIHKKRPVLIVSNNIINQNSFTVIIVPLSSIVPQILGPDMIKVTKLKGLDQESVILADQIKSIDKQRLGKKIGSISKEKIRDVEDTLKIVLDLSVTDPTVS